ncbi:MAG: hypothetical protein V1859_05460 [archaeon]
MKARWHLAIGILLLATLFFIEFISGQQIIYWISYNTNISLLEFLTGILLYVVGLILPDSDMTHGKSRIFHSNFFVFGLIARLLEIPLSIIFGRKIGHRESLHTIIGVMTTSVFISLFVCLIFYLGNSFHWLTFPYLFLCLSTGQIVHLLCDWYWKLK